MLELNENTNLEQSKLLLFDAFLCEENFNRLLELSSKLLGNPLIVIDLSYRIVGYSNSEDISDDFWVKFIQQGYCDYDFVIQVNALPCVKIGKISKTTYEVQCSQSDHKKLVCNLVSNGVIKGNIILLGCKKEVAESDFNLLSVVSKVIALKMKQITNTPKDTNIVIQDFLYDVLNHNFISRNEMNERMKIVNLKFQKELRIIVFDIERLNDIQKSCNDVINIFSNHHIQMEYSVFYEHRIVMIYQQNTLEDFKEKLLPLLNKYNIYVGVSQPFSDLFMCKKYYLQAIKTIDLAKHAYPDRHYINYYEVQYYSLLPSLQPDSYDQDFYHPTLKRLKEYDEQHNTDLYDILYVFIINDGNIQKTAQDFFVHRNTVRYKINKIKELTSIDFTDILNILNMLISYRICQYLTSIKNET